MKISIDVKNRQEKPNNKKRIYINRAKTTTTWSQVEVSMICGCSFGSQNSNLEISVIEK
jgi:hypothetical protein